MPSSVPGETLVLEAERFDPLTESLLVLSAVLLGALGLSALSENTPLAVALLAIMLLFVVSAIHRYVTRRAIVYRVVVDARHMEAGPPRAPRRLDFADCQRVVLHAQGDTPFIEIIRKDRRRVRIDGEALDHAQLGALAAFLYRVCPLPCSDAFVPERNRPARTVRG